METDLLPIEVCGNRMFDFFCFRDLDLDPMTFIYELDSYPFPICRMCN